MGIFALITTLLPLLTQLLGSSGVISPNLAGLVGKLAASIPTLIQSFIAGKGSATAEIETILQELETEVNVLKNGTTLFTLNEANLINAVTLAISNAIAAYKASAVADDPSMLTPLPETL